MPQPAPANQNIPCSGSHAAYSGESTLCSGNYTPRSGEYTLHSGNYAPRSGNYTLHSGEHTTYSGEYAPYSGNRIPYPGKIYNRRITMSITRDWLPHTRTDILAMARDWQAVAGPKAGDWNIPAPTLTELGTLIQAADAALAAAQNETTRTPVATARCKEAFDALMAFMRDFKRRYFLTPPLTDSDYVALGLKPRDTTPTASGAPTAQAAVETFLVGRHELGIKIVYVTGSPSDPANKGYRVWYSAVAPGETPPANPEDLRKSFFTMRKKDLVEFDFEDSGKTAYFAVIIENGGKQGPAGPVVSALIP
jgi:hypothetical protein